jgi:hypothetical protein
MVRRMLRPEIDDTEDSGERAVQNRSGRQYPFVAVCYNGPDSLAKKTYICPEFGIEKTFFAIRGGNNMIHVPDVWCGVCVTQMTTRPKDD